MEGADGGRGGLAPLAGAIDDDAVLRRVEDLGLCGVWGELQAAYRPF